MASQSPQRSRKPTQSLQQQQQQDRQQTSATAPSTTSAMGASSSGGVQPTGRRDPSPSPSARERYARTQSMPIIAPLSKIQQQSATQQGQKTQIHQRHPSSPSQESFKTGPTYKDIGVQDDDSELPQLLPSSHPPLLQTHSFPLAPPSQQQQQNRYPQPQPTRAHPPQFITRLQDESDVWHMTPELINDIERADFQQQVLQHSPPAPGTEGVAYAGGAGGGGGSFSRYGTNTSQKSSGDKGGSGGSSGSAGRNQVQPREGGREVVRDNSQGVLPRNARGSSRPLTPEARPNSPAFYAHAQNQAPTPPAMRRGTTGSPTVPIMYNNAPSPRPLKNRTPDRSLPVQEEPDDHENGHNTEVASGLGLQRGHVSPTPSSDLNPTNDLRASPHQGKDQEVTLIDVGPGPGDRGAERPQQQIAKKLSDEDDADLSYTPRSPSVALPEQGKGIHEILDVNGVKAHDQNAFNAAAFEQTMKKLQAGADERGGQRQNQPPLSSRNDSRQSWYGSWIHDYYQAYGDDREHFYDEMAYFQQYIQTPVSTNSRPNAPVPPTPRSQNGARSPLPRQPLQPMPRTLVPPFSPAPPGGTPYPYPFSHLRRGYTYPARVSRLATPATVGAGPMYEPTLEEQLEYQLHMYAMNNGGGAITESTLSPSSTPYPGMGRNYHPFSAFLNATRNRAAHLNGEGEGDGEHISVSRRSSPSHMPVPLPPPTFRGRGLKKRSRFTNIRSGHGANGRARVNPPPRVESTQPKDTSPEPSSGEETAGEKYVPQIQQGGEWVDDENSPNGSRQPGDENGEWVDEDSEDEESYLGLEYHPTYINNPDRRRKKWEQKWNDLNAAFRALDQQTDTTMILLAAPSHTNQLYSLASRSIRRDASLLNHPAMPSVREGFGQIASQRRAARASQVSLIERLYAYTSGSEDGSPTTATSSREDDLKRALNAAIASLSAMKQMYDMREARWVEESRRNAEEREGVEMLLGQVLGGLNQPTSVPQIAPTINGGTT